MPSFQVNARYVLLTYAQCGDLDPHAIVNHLATLGCECIIGRENHADGGIHLHVFCDFGRKFRSRRTDVFDVGGRHPNIEASRGHPERGYDYAIKDGDVVAGGLERPSERGATGADDKWGTIVRAQSEQEFWDLLERLDPKALATNFGNLRKFADWKFRPQPVIYEHPDGINFDLGLVPDLVAWRDQYLGGEASGGKSFPLPPVHFGGFARRIRSSRSRGLGPASFCSFYFTSILGVFAILMLIIWGRKTSIFGNLGAD